MLLCTVRFLSKNKARLSNLMAFFVQLTHDTKINIYRSFLTFLNKFRNGNLLRSTRTKIIRTKYQTRFYFQLQKDLVREKFFKCTFFNRKNLENKLLHVRIRRTRCTQRFQICRIVSLTDTRFSLLLQSGVEFG
jgi:replication initiation and membrane attachment protein DnaB